MHRRAFFGLIAGGLAWFGARLKAESPVEAARWRYQIHTYGPDYLFGIVELWQAPRGNGYIYQASMASKACIPLALATLKDATVARGQYWGMDDRERLRGACEDAIHD